VPAEEIPSRVGQAVEALESVPLLAEALKAAAVEAPVTTALSKLIEGQLPLDEWVAVVRTTVPPPARWRPPVRPGFWRRLRERIRSWFTRRREELSPSHHDLFTNDELGAATVDHVHEQQEERDASDHRDDGPVQ
jgi:hypothetical protein